MAKYQYSESIQFILPAGYEYNRWFDENGDEKQEIRYVIYEDEYGHRNAEFNCFITEGRMDANENTRGKSIRQVWEAALSEEESIRKCILPGEPATMFMSTSVAIKLLGKELNMVVLTAHVAISERDYIIFSTRVPYRQESPNQVAEILGRLITVVKSVYVRGKELPLSEVTDQQLIDALHPDFNKAMVMDTGVKLELNITGNGETTTYTYDSDDTPWSKTESNEALYPNSSGILFDRDNVMALGDHLLFPVPDGYQFCTEGTGENSGWAYIVPKHVSLSANHIDAVPYSFAVTTSSGAHIEYESKYLEVLKKVFLSKGYLSKDIVVESLVVSDKCGFLYQNQTNPEDDSYHKINGFLFAGEDVYQFHIYANHFNGIRNSPRTLMEFLEVSRAWMEQVRMVESDLGLDVADKFDPRLLTPEEYYADENGVLKNCFTTKTDIVLPNTISAIGEFCFLNQTITTVLVPDSITSIGKYAFKGCTGIVDITIPDGVTSVGESAFAGCTGLTDITIPKSVTSIGESVFEGCTGLTNITIPDGVTSIGESAFAGCTGLTNITIPESVTSIGASAFDGCTGLMSITIPDTVVTVKGWAFHDCTGLRTIILSGNLEELDMFAFDGCTNVTKVILLPGSARVPFGLYGVKDSVAEIIIPEGVTHIEEEAFSGFTQLKSLTLPQSLREIDTSAFLDCTGLEKITLPEGLSVIGLNAFCNCSSLESITIPGSVVHIEECAFQDCVALTNVTISEGVTSIASQAFDGCTELTDIVIPRSVTKIADSVFAGCAKLTIHCPETSFAHNYAQSERIPCDSK